MNFLSHLYLSGDQEGIILGNFIADSVKGSNYKNYTSEIQAGILLHRQIDSFTDSHLIVEESKKRLRSKYRKYSGVIVDIFYDHFLAANWQDFSAESLNDYSQKIYTLIQKNHSVLPENSIRFSEYMVHYNILEAYSRMEGIEQVLKGMAGRTKFKSDMEHAINDLKEHYNLFESEFRLFFPELKQFVKTRMDI
jgi:acyl carrier protein phosphodiesterase